MRIACGNPQGNATNELCLFDWLEGPRNVAKPHLALQFMKPLCVAFWIGMLRVCYEHNFIKLSFAFFNIIYRKRRKDIKGIKKRNYFASLIRCDGKLPLKPPSSPTPPGVPGKGSSATDSVLYLSL